MWYSIPNRSSQGLLEPLKPSVYSMLPYAAGHLVSLFFCLLLHCLFRIFFHCSHLWFLFLFFVYSWLKANLSLTICFLFCPFVLPSVVHLEFLASASSPTSHREVATCPLMNCSSSSSNSSVFHLLCVMIHPPAQRSNQTSDFYMPQLNFSLRIRFPTGRNLCR